MKALLNLTLTSLLLLLLSGNRSAAQSTAKEKFDKLIFLDGTTREGKVLAFTDDKLQFVHKGETLQYQFSKNEIERIEYASGRTENITSRKDVAAIPLKNFDNKVAVLPLPYINESGGNKIEEMPYRLQELAASFMRKEAKELKLQDPAETNALLNKAGVTPDKIRNYTPKELATILEVEYVIRGSVLQEAGQVSVVTNTQRNGDNKLSPATDGLKFKQNNNEHSIATSNQDIKTSVMLSVYNYKGETIYSDSKKSILNTTGAYKNSLQYLLKRTPLYKR